jgi:hypothetical protein
MKTWYEKIKETERKGNIVPKKPKNLGSNICPGCGESLGFVLIQGKNGNWINEVWYSGSFFHCSKHEQINKGS